ncbi:MAG: sulfide/dihydroorotate dehydrogenase-like FAD/NAD-binding protein, partial [bacterium]|nr:sulfide/dihydroorotate dehydrogenase-like FAD/NAD-binding protein [bacterium]
MNKILEKIKLSNDVYQMKIDAPLIAEERKAGQFIILLIEQEFGERIP